jgi:surface protein
MSKRTSSGATVLIRSTATTLITALLLTACSDSTPPTLTWTNITPSHAPPGATLTLTGIFPTDTTFTICNTPTPTTLTPDRSTRTPNGNRIRYTTTATTTVPDLPPGSQCQTTATSHNDTITGPPFEIDPTPPNPPTLTALRAYPDQNALTLELTPPTNDGGATITHYQANLHGTWQDLTPHQDRYQLTGVTPGTRYTITTRAINRAGASPPSNPLPITIQPPPAPPTDLTITPGDGIAIITFTYDDTDDIRLQIRRGNDPWEDEPFDILPDDTPITPTRITPTKGTRATTTTTTTTTTTFTLRLWGDGGTSTPTEPITITPSPPPNPPTGITLTPNDTTITITWNPPAESPNPVTHHTATATPGNATCQAPMPTLTCTLQNLTNGTAYQVAVTATNAAGTSPTSTPAQATPMGLPSAPTDLTLTANGLDLTASWGSANPNGSPILTYTATLDPNGTECTTTPPTTTCTFPNLTPGTTYTIQVTATNAVGTSPAAQSDSILIATLPSTPRNLTITPADTALTITWNTPTTDGGTPITHYTATTTPDDATCTTTDTTCTITGLTNGTTYDVTVTATNAIGTGPAATGQGTPVPDVSAPSAPRNVVVTAAAYALEVTWDTPADDGKSPITSYQVTLDPGGATCTTTPPTTTCTIENLANDTTYAVTVTATNAIGMSAPATTNGTTLDLESFIIVVDTRLGTYGTGANANTVNLPFTGAVNITIDWGGANQDCATVVDQVLYGELYCTYDQPGEYTIKVRGTATAFGSTTVAGDNDKKHYQSKLVRVESWGTVGLISLAGAFMNADNFEEVPNYLPDTVTDLQRTFANTVIFDDPNVSTWDVSNVTEYLATFIGAKAFNQDLSDWDVAAGTRFQAMFEGAITFNQPMNDWTLSAATDASRMFRSATAFNNGCDEGDTSCPFTLNDTDTVTTFLDLFSNTGIFNQHVTLDTSAATTMSGMFVNAAAFNNGCAAGVQDDECTLDLDTADVTTFLWMFYGAKAFNQKVDHWNTSKVTNFYGVFQGAEAFNQSLNGWDTAAATTLLEAFMAAKAFNNGCVAGDRSCPLSWDTSSVTTMTRTFVSAFAFDQDLPWDTSAVTSFESMFASAVVFDGDVTAWDTSAATTMKAMFQSASTFDRNIGSWDTSSVTDMDFMFQGASMFNGAIGDWNTANVTTMARMFLNASSFGQDLSGWCVSSIASAPDFFSMNPAAGFVAPSWGTCPP